MIILLHAYPWVVYSIIIYTMLNSQNQDVHVSRLHIF